MWRTHRVAGDVCATREANYRVWQRRSYDMNIWSHKKRLEKLGHMHNIPVKRGLAKSPGDWPWSSWRFNYLQDALTITIDTLA